MFMGCDLVGKIFGILGMGSIGCNMVVKVCVFGMKI